MSVAKVTELSPRRARASRTPSSRASSGTKTLRNVKSAWIKDMRVEIENDKVSAYQVNMQVTFVLEN